MSFSALKTAVFMMLATSLSASLCKAGELPAPAKTLPSVLVEIWQICDIGMSDLDGAYKFAEEIGWSWLGPESEYDSSWGMLDVQKEVEIKPPKKMLGDLPDQTKTIVWLSIIKQDFPHTSASSCRLGSGGESLHYSVLQQIDEFVQSTEGFKGALVLQEPNERQKRLNELSGDHPPPRDRTGRWSFKSEADDITVLLAYFTPTTETSLIFQRFSNASKETK